MTSGVSDLGMDLGIAVALGGGGVEVASVVFSGEVEGVDGACGADEQGFRAEARVVDGAGGRGKVEDVIYHAWIERTRMFRSRRLKRLSKSDGWRRLTQARC